MVETTYEIYVDSAYGSDILRFDTLEEAKEEAKEWSKKINKPLRVVIIKHINELVGEYENGFETTSCMEK